MNIQEKINKEMEDYLEENKSNYTNEEYHILDFYISDIKEYFENIKTASKQNMNEIEHIIDKELNEEDSIKYLGLDFLKSYLKVLEYNV